MKKFLFMGLVLLSMPLLACSALAQTTDFDLWKQSFIAEAQAQGINAATLQAALAGVSPIERIIELDRAQPEGRLSLAEYLQRTVPQSRIKRGQGLLHQHQALLADISARYGVQPRFIVALWGKETDFGRNMGGFNVIAALATLAYDGRRSDYFRAELMQALRIIDAGHVAVDDMRGSWAGAMGHCQFMPTSYWRYAVDYDGDGHANIWSSLPDAFASIANYLAQEGWQGDQSWGRKVSLPDNFAESLLGQQNKRSLDEWRQLGVRKNNGQPLPKADLTAAVVQPNGQGTQAYLAYDNFRVLLHWNRSSYFAIAVGTLADALN